MITIYVHSVDWQRFFFLVETGFGNVLVIQQNGEHGYLSPKRLLEMAMKP